MLRTLPLYEQTISTLIHERDAAGNMSRVARGIQMYNLYCTEKRSKETWEV